VKRCLAILVLAASVAFTLRADPYVGYAYPSSVQVGTTNRIVVGGQRFWGLASGWVSGEGVEVVKIEKVPGFGVPNGKGQRQWLENWIYGLYGGKSEMPSLEKVADADLAGWTRCSWWETMDKLTAAELAMLAHNLFTPRNALQMSPSLAEQAIVTVAVRPDAAPGVRRMILFDGRGASAPHPLIVTRERHVAEPLYAPPLRKKERRRLPEPPLVSPPVVLDGQILPGETDVFKLSLKGGERLSCQLLGREFTPYLGDAVPGFFNPVLRLTDADGRELAFADDYGYLPDPILVCEIPSNGVYRLEVRDNLYRGRVDFVYSIACSTDTSVPSVATRAFAVACRPDPPSETTSGDGFVWTDTLQKPGSVCERTFKVERSGEWTFELFARRNGSPLDGVVRLEGPLTGHLFWKSSPLLATWDDITNTVYVGSVPQAECDPIGRWKFTKPGTYRLTVLDRVGAGGEGYDFTLSAKPIEPSFEIYAKKSSFVLMPGKGERVKFDVRVVRQNGFHGSIKLEGGRDWKLRPAQIPATAEVMRVTAEAVKRDWTGMREFKLFATAKIGAERTKTVQIVPADEAEQAFAYTHLLPSEAFRVLAKSSTLPPAETPKWMEMPYDKFLPRRVIRPHAELGTNTCDSAAIDRLAKIEVPIVLAPTNAEDSVLWTRFATSAAHLRSGRPSPTVAFEPMSGDMNLQAAWSVLAGVERFVGPKLDYLDGDAQRVRTFARAAALQHDNDILVYVPTNAVNPLAGEVGAAARRLREEGWSFDFVTDKTIAKAPFGRFYRAVIIPGGLSVLSDEARLKLEKLEKKKTIKILQGKEDTKEFNRILSKQCRRDFLPKGVRYARFGQDWGEEWYFVHNPTDKTISGEWRFSIRGQANTAYAMEVSNGNISPLKRKEGKGAPRYLYSLAPGVSAWIYTTVRKP